MFQLSEKMCIVIPCFNEEKRLDIEKFKGFKDDHYFLFVNDGSKDDTVGLLKRNQQENFFVLDLQKNSGKAEAVRQGMLHIKTLPILDEIKWVGFWDADLSTPLEELANFMIYYKTFNPGADSIWGSRVRRFGSNIVRTYKRHILGRVFANVTSFFLKLKCYDSQCGAKLFKKELVEEVFFEPFISRWIFDVEILMRLKNYNIVEYPLNTWVDVAGSKVKMLPVAYKTFVEIFRIRRKYMK
jgi:glycosyltransferase involved in cell wall biosynthesis